MTNNNPTPSPITRRFLPVWLNGVWGRLGIAAGLYLIPYLAWYYFKWGGEANVTLISDLASLPLDLLAPLVAWRVATQRRLDAHVRRTWLLLGLALFSFLIADLFWLYFENFLEVPPFPSIADIFYLSIYPLVLWGLLALPKVPLNRRERSHFFSDLAIVMTVATMYSWYFIIQPTAAGYQGDLLAQLIAAAYPIGDLVVLVGIVTILFRWPEANTRSAMLLFAAGMIVYMISDVTFGYTSLTGTYATGSWIDTGWVIANAFFIWAALRQMYVSPFPSLEPKPVSSVDQFTRIFPFMAVGLGYGLMLYVTLVDFNGADTIWLFAGAVLLTILMISGQIAAIGFANLSLRAKLVLAFLGVTVLSVGVVALVVNQVIRVNLTNQVGTNLQALAEVKAQQIAELLDHRLETLKTFGLSPIFRDGVEATRAHTSSDPAEIQEQLQQLDRRWDVLADNDPLVLKVLGHRTSHDMREFQQHFPGFIEIFVTNQYGELVGATQRTANYDFSGEVWWQSAYNQGQGGLYIGQPEFNNQLSAFGVIMAVPVRSRFDQSVIGVLRSTYSLAALTEGLNSARFGQTGGANLLLPSGQILFADGRLEPVEPAILAQLEALADIPYTQLTFQGAPRLVSQAPITDREADGETEQIQQINWKLVVDQDTAEALAPVGQAAQIALLVSLGVLLLAAILALYVAQQLVQPITRLTALARQISGGDLSVQAPVEAKDEIGALATTFNTMTGRLRQTLAGLENRSQGLETIANLSEHLAAILKLDELLPEVVSQIKEKFGYYHAQIYLLDESSSRKGEGLVVAAGTGSAGAEMKARGHYIPLDAPVSLVARAARTGEIVRVDNVRETVDWLPNPLLPDTYSELAVPIILDERIVGVLDVQQDRPAGLDEADAHLLRSLANHVAVTIRNARQFAEVQAALAEAHELQRRYIEQAWDHTQVTRQKVGRVQFSQAGPTTLDPTAIAQARRHALDQKQPVVVALNGGEPGSGAGSSAPHPSPLSPEAAHGTPYALVAPVTLRNVTIGNLQLHDDPNRVWTAGDLALINAVLDQIAQIAENLRLVAETQERASREKLINQISEKLRRAPDMETLIQTGVAELAHALNPGRAFVHMKLNKELASVELSSTK
jgi:GAF domain-containing protein/HAMP domain-containing protein